MNGRSTQIHSTQETDFTLKTKYLHSRVGQSGWAARRGRASSGVEKLYTMHMVKVFSGFLNSKIKKGQLALCSLESSYAILHI